MKNISKDELEQISGGGCYKHLRRMHRANKKGDSEKAARKYTAYVNCMLDR